MSDVYVTGWFQDQSFNLFNQDNTPSEVVLKNSTGSGGNFYNAFLAKYSSAGQALWGAPMGGINQKSFQTGFATSVDTYGNVYVSGQFQDLSFNLYNGDSTLSQVLIQNPTQTQQGAYHCSTFLAKYNSAGIAQWGAPIGSTQQGRYNQGFGVATDAHNSIYVTGHVYDQSLNLYNGDSSFSGKVISNPDVDDGNSCVFLAKYNLEGIPQWGVAMGGSGPEQFDKGLGITTDLVGNVYVTGFFLDISFNLFSVDNPPIVLQNSTGGGGYYNTFLAKYNSQGNAQWGVNMGAPTTNFIYDLGIGVTVDTVGNVYVSGHFFDQSFNLYNSDRQLSSVILANTSGGGGQYNAFLAKYNKDGFAQWGAPLGTSMGAYYPAMVGFENGSFASHGINVAITANNQLYVSGNYTDLSFNLYSGDNTLTPLVLQNPNQAEPTAHGFIANYNSNTGQVNWATQMGGTVLNSGLRDKRDQVLGMTVDTDGFIYVTGQFLDQSYNLYSSGNSSLPAAVLKNSTEADGNYNAFVAKYNSTGQAVWGAAMGSLIGNGNVNAGFGVAVQRFVTQSNICFPGSTPIKTDQGYVRIDQLRPGKHTIGRQAIRDITKTITPDKYLVCFEAHALGKNYPSAKTIMTKDHKIHYKTFMLAAEEFAGKFEKVYKIKYTGEILYNVLLAEHSQMSVNNLLCETLDPANLIAKLYTQNSKHTSTERERIVVLLEDSLKKKDVKAYQKICQRC